MVFSEKLTVGLLIDIRQNSGKVATWWLHGFDERVAAWQDKRKQTRQNWAKRKT